MRCEHDANSDDNTIYSPLMSTLSVPGAYCMRENPDVRAERAREREREGERGRAKGDRTDHTIQLQKDK